MVTSFSESLLALASEYEAGLQKMVASGYEEFGPDVQRRHRMVIDALRFQANALRAIPIEADFGTVSAADPERETYLGDGLYASIEHDMIKLRAPRYTSDHVVYLEGPVLLAFVEFLTAQNIYLPPQPRKRD